MGAGCSARVGAIPGATAWMLPPALVAAAGVAGEVAMWQHVIVPFEFKFDRLNTNLTI
jgi:hypothetical protein